tara:strand:- start:323 stop:517 length:195 start_codon:yes stop_codon:yes gene_type:complete
MKHRLCYSSFVIVITWDNRDPSVYGGYDSEEDATKGIEKIRGMWDKSDWNHHTSITVEIIEKGV